MINTISSCISKCYQVSNKERNVVQILPRSRVYKAA